MKENYIRILAINILIISFLSQLTVGFMTPYLNQILHLLTKDEWAKLEIIIAVIPLTSFLISRVKENYLIWITVILDIIAVIVTITIIIAFSLRSYLILDTLWSCVFGLLYNLRYVVFTSYLSFLRDKIYQGRRRTMEALGFLIGSGISLWVDMKVTSVLIIAQVIMLCTAIIGIINNRLLTQIKY